MQEKSNQLPPGGGTEYYMQPVHKQQSNGGAPPLPAKLWTKPADATLPTSKPPSPPRTKSVRECYIIHSRILKPLVDESIHIVGEQWYENSLEMCHL